MADQPPPDLQALAQQWIDQANRYADQLRQQAEKATQQLAAVNPFANLQAGPPADEEALVRQILADPTLKEKVLALAGQPPAPG